jgi:predicted transcriptional regulator
MSTVKRRIIEFLKSYQGVIIPQSHIHRALGVSKSRVSEVLRELELEGLIERHSIGKSKVVYIKPGFSERRVEVQSKVLKLGLVYSSEYLFLGGFIKRLVKRGYSVEVRVYRDGLRATRALAEGEVQAVLSPLVGQLYLYPAYKTYRVVLRGLRGGFRVLYKEGSSIIYSSLISTMDYVRYYALSRRLVEATSTVYYTDPSDLRELSIKGGYVVTWHPVYLELENRGFKAIYTPSDLDADFCCTLGVSRTLSERDYTLVKKAYFESLEDYSKRPEKYLEYYSALTGIDTPILKSATREYTIASELDSKAIDKVVSVFAPSVPSRDLYHEAVH